MEEEFNIIKSSRYDFIQEISKKDNSFIYIVRDTHSKSRVVIKYLKLSENPIEQTTHFINEARIVAALEHPNIIPIHDIQMHPEDSPPYYTMKLVKGESLSTIINKLKLGDELYKKKYTRNTLLQIFLKVCDAISFTHSKNVLNLNIEPSNIKIGEFGEVYIVEWGRAKYYKKHNSDTTATNQTLHNLMFHFSKDNQSKGVLGYIPLEQVQLSVDDLDIRTDIYSLGAILYFILTLEQPISGVKDTDIIEKMKQKDFLIPPCQRTPKLNIPPILSKIVMKAMSLSINQRYKSVRSMQNDVLNFLQNKETLVYPDNLYRKLSRISSRHKHIRNIIVLVVFFLVISFLYVHNQQQKILSTWIPKLEVSMDSANEIKQYFSLEKNLNEETFPILEENVDSSSFKMPSGKWLWIKKHHFDDSLRIVIDFNWDDISKIDGFEVCFNTKKIKTSKLSNLPSGYSIQIGGWKGRLNLISINRNDAPPDMSNAVPCNISDTGSHKLIIERRDEIIDVFIDNKKILSEVDPLPFLSGEYGGIGLRSWSNSLNISNFKVYTRVLPIYSSPLVVGDAFYRIGMHKKAMKEYMDLSAGHYDSSIREMALRKLIIVTKKLKKMRLHGQLLSEFQKEFPNSLFNDKIITQNIFNNWKEQKYNKVFKLFNNIDENLKKVLIARKILHEPHIPLPNDVGQKLLEILALENIHFSLDISDYSLNSLEPLKDLDLKILDCANNKIDTLIPIQDMCLEILNVKNNNLSSTNGIQNSPIKILNISHNPIKNIADLNHKTLKILNAEFTNIENVEFLKNQPVEYVNMSYCPIKNIDPLEKCSEIKKIFLNRTDVNNIDTLKHLKLEILRIGRNYNGGESRIKSISSLDVSELQMLTCEKLELDNLNVLENALNLNSLNISNTKVDNIEFFNKLKNNEFENLTFENSPIVSIEPLRNINTTNLSLSNLLITDLSPIIDKNFELFPVLYGDTLPEQEMKKISTIWKQKIKDQKYSKYMDILIMAFCEKNYKALKLMASEINNKKYLYIDYPMSYKDAIELANKAGGKLLALETQEEFNAIIPLLKEHKKDIWIALKKNNKGHYVSNNIPINWDINIDETSKIYCSENKFFITLADGLSIKYANKNPLGRSCIIEFD